MQRRVQDSRFATRYLVGYGLHICGAYDSPALFADFFPLIRKIVIYDKKQGGAQKPGNVDDKPFEFLYSSHVRNAVQA